MTDAKSRGDSATRAAKAFLGVASIAGTLGGWAVLASKEPAAPGAQPVAEKPELAPRASPSASVATSPAPVRAVRVKRTRRVPITMTRSS